MMKSFIAEAHGQHIPKKNNEESDADTELDTMSVEECTSAGHNQEHATVIVVNELL